MNPAKATAALESIDPKDLEPYREYFETITPKDETEIFRRGLFAFASVHTSYRSNVNLFSLLYDLSWTESEKELRKIINESRAGLINGRTENIWNFNQRYWADPKWYQQRDDEMWIQFRDRVQARTPGLGFAKSAFYCELYRPNDCEVLCVDTHLLQAYGLEGNSSPSQKTYGYIEAHWVSECKRLGLPVTAARWYLWDLKQGHPGDSSYWAYCLEGGKPDLMCPRQLEMFSYAETSGKE